MHDPENRKWGSECCKAGYECFSNVGPPLLLFAPVAWCRRVCGAVVQFWGDRGEELRPIIALSAGANCATLLEFLNSI